jgi:hypothetical protein
VDHLYGGDAFARQRGGGVSDGLCGGERWRRGEGQAAAEPDLAPGLYPDESGVLAGSAFVFAAGFVCFGGAVAKVGRVGAG